jgi:HlyD family secretion protein
MNTSPKSWSRRHPRRGGARAWAVGLAAAGAVCVGGYLALADRNDTGDAAPRTADIAEARRLAFEITTTSSGELESRNKVEIRNKLEQQTVIQSIVPEGTRVKAGDLLIELNAESLQTRIDEEKPRLASAKSELVAAQNDHSIQSNDNASAVRKAELSVAIAELTLLQWLEGDVVKRRQELHLKIDKASLELERLAQKYLRSQQLLAEGFLSKDECDRDEVAYIEAISNFKTSNLELEVYEKYEFVKEEKQKLSELAEAKAELERVRINNESQLASKKARLDNAAEQVAIAESKTAKLKSQLESATIRAPQDGLVVYGTSVDRMRWGMMNGESMQIGQQVYPNQLLMILPDTSDMMATIRVHESLAGRIKPGQRVAVKIDAAGGKVFEGSVESIGVMAESGGWRDPNLREYAVQVKLDIRGESLKPAMRCEARVVLESVPETLTVPVQAIFSEGAVQYVYLPRGPKFVKTPVKVGRRSDTTAELAAGLDPGARVLVREPAAGEVLSQPWNPEQLKLAGYDIGENGEVLVARAPAPIKPAPAVPATPNEPDTKTAAAADEGKPQAALDAAPPAEAKALN